MGIMAVSPVWNAPEIVQTSRGQLGVLAAGIRVFQGQREVVEVLQFVVFAAQQRELAVVHCGG